MLTLAAFILAVSTLHGYVDIGCGDMAALSLATLALAKLTSIG